MSRKTTAALIAALGINFAIAGGALMLANLNQPTAYDASAELSLAGGEAVGEVAGVAAQPAAGDLVVALKAAQQGGNTRVSFTCGKAIPGGREVHAGTWDSIGGAVLYRPKSQTLAAIEAVFDTRSLRTDEHALTTTVTTKEKWFDIDNHPTARFVCNQVKPIEPGDSASASSGSAWANREAATHELIGTFTLNGITKPIAIPARLAFAGPSLTLDASFVILRSDYQVDKRSSSVAGTLGGAVSEVDDQVQMTVRLTASPDPMLVIAELAKDLEAQHAEIASINAQLKRATAGIDLVSQKFRDMESKIERMAMTSPKTVDLSNIPNRYTDTLATGTQDKRFDMVLVPGDASKAIDPFYLSTHEVRWAMLIDWIYSDEVTEAQAAAEIEAGFRPSKVWGTLAQQFQVGHSDHPAMGMTLLTAEAYCKWLSEKTGRRYRLPTRDEWLHAFDLGGGMPENLSDYAWHAGNAVFDDKLLQDVTGGIGTKKPNKLGVYDMLGNVAEWVTQTGEQRLVVGGSIGEQPEQITRDWVAVEDFDVWSASYPQLPISRYWYVDYYYSGIRLVCEPASVAANPPVAKDE